MVVFASPQMVVSDQWLSALTHSLSKYPVGLVYPAVNVLTENDGGDLEVGENDYFLMNVIIFEYLDCGIICGLIKCLLYGFLSFYSINRFCYLEITHDI